MIKFKEEKYYLELITNKVRSEIRMLLAVIAAWLEFYGIDLVVTSVLDEKGINRKSSTHKTGRAFDISIKDWPEGLAQKCTDWINKMFSTGIPGMLVAVLHDAGYGGDHIHIQIGKGRPLIINTELGGYLL